MGLPLRDLVTPTELPWEELAGRTLAVDAYNALYQFLATIRQRDGQLFTDDRGRVTSHLIGMLGRTTSLLAEGVRPVWVFDGPPPALKSGTLSGRFRLKEKAEAAWQEALAAGDLETARRKAAATSRLTSEMVAEARALLDALGVPSFVAPSEGEAQAAAMAATEQVWACASEDYDSLLFRAPRLVRGLAARNRGGEAPAAQVIDRARTLETLGLSDEELILVGVVIGTDYNDGVRGYGPKKALKLAQQHLGWDASIAQVGLDPAEAAAVRELFEHPAVTAVPDPEFREPDESALRHLLVDEHGFSETRVVSALGRSRKARASGPARSPPPGRQVSLENFG